MKKQITFIALAFVQTFLFAQTAQQNNSASSQAAFNSAFAELKNMLEGKDSLNYEKAVFITENAYYDNRFDYNEFKLILDLHTKLIISLADNAKQEYQENYKTMKIYEQKMFNLNTSNWAIFKYLTDTILIKDLFFTHYKYPLNYSTDDPYGSSRWENTQVIHLLASDNQKGNCYALSSLFKIFSDRLKSDAQLAIAPHHIYIQNRNQKGDYKNIELTTKTFPGDGTIQTLTYTTHELIMNGMSERALNDKDAVALNLIYLAKSFEHKFNDNTNDFLLKCADLAFKHDTLSLNALLLKAEVTENRLLKAMTENKIKTVAQARANLQTQKLLTSYEKQLNNFYKIGYREIPKDIEHILLSAIQGNKDGYITTDKTPNPFASIGQNQRYATLSWGLFDEYHANVDTIEYFHASLNTKTKKIIEFLPIDTTNSYKVDPVVFAMSVDPLAQKYPHQSPYVAFNNNPIIYTDPDGRDGIISIKGNTITVSAQIHLYGSGATAATAKQMQGDVMKTWGVQSNGKGWSYTDAETGKTYDVKFDIKVDLYEGKEKNDPTIISESWNPSNRENFVEVGATLKDVGRSNVRGGDEGEWRGVGRNGNTLAQDDPAPHEAGHILGLGDQYTDDKGTNKGWENNVMGDSDGKVDQRNINGIVGDAVKGLNKFQSDKSNAGKEYKYEINIDNPKK